MKTTKGILTFILLIGMLPILSAGCSGNPKKEEGKKARAEWVASLDDSIKFCEWEIDSCKNNIQILHDKVGDMLKGFVAISNPREVEGYTIRNGWQNRYPLQSTGIIARITMDEGFELIAANTGKPFQQIEVRSGDKSCVSEIVPHDQGLNYRRGNLTTVLFSGEKADSIGMFISENSLNGVTLVFINNGPVSSMKIPHDNLNMIADTWMVYSTHKEVERLEREVPILHQKINVLRQTIEREKDAAVKNNEKQ